MAERRELGYIRKLPSGRYQASYIGPDMQRYNGPVTFEAKDLAIVWLHNEKKRIAEAAADDLPWLSPAARLEEARRQLMPKETFGEYATRWIDERRNSKGEPLRLLTQKDYRHILAAYLMPTFGKRPIDAIAGRPPSLAWEPSQVLDAPVTDQGVRAPAGDYELGRRRRPHPGLARPHPGCRGRSDQAPG